MNRQKRILPLTLLLLWVLYTSTTMNAAERFIESPGATASRLWPSQPPADCPFGKSEAISGIAFTGRRADYTWADTWYPSWAEDGNLYSPYTDGGVGDDFAKSWLGPDANTGQAIIAGDNPQALKVTSLGLYLSSASPYGGRYPCGSLVYNGVWYYGTYCLLNDPPHLNWAILGPTVGFRWSTDFGKTWHQTPHTPEKPLFPEPNNWKDPVKMGAPHFVDFGKNMMHSPDGKAYLVGHGATAPDRQPRENANLSWISGDEIYLARVTPSIETINNLASYEFFAGRDEKGKAIWTGDFSRIVPILDWNNHCGCVTMTYNAPLKKYLIFITDGYPTIKTFDTHVWEADEITGPWKLITYMERFGEEAYFVNLPSKFISTDGRTAWLCYAANFAQGYNQNQPFWSNPRGSRYGMCLQEIRLLSPQDTIPAHPVLDIKNNIAPMAQLAPSSVCQDYSIEGLVDGRVPDPNDVNPRTEWASAGEKKFATLRLVWDYPVPIDRVILYDRPNPIDQVKAGMLVFSDGSTEVFGELPDDGQKGLDVTFTARKTQWMMVIITAIKDTTANIGLSEIAVMKAAETLR